MSLHIAAYDISDERRRERVARVLLGYGLRVQRSVFQVWLDPEDLPDFRREVGSELASSDSFVVYPVDERGTRRILSWQRSVPANPPIIVIS